MKNILLIIFFSIFLSCDSQENDKKLILSFINNIILSNQYELEELNKYLFVNDKILNNNTKKKFLIELLNTSILEIKTKIEAKGASYKILSHKDLLKINISSNLKYDDYSKVYYLIVNNKITNPFIIENKKIISFFYGLTKHKRNSYPWMLNKYDLTE